MNVTGIIFASVDCDVDAIEDWNRWYDLCHLPPNIALPGIMSGRRYVAPPELHELRAPGALEGFSEGRGVHTTVYLLCGDPLDVMADMTTYRDMLEDAGRMFAPEKKVVRAGDAMYRRWQHADPALLADDIDVPFIAHTGKVVVLRDVVDGADADEVDAWYRDEWAPLAVGVDGVHAVVSFESAYVPARRLDLVLIEGDPATVVPALRAAAPHHDQAAVVLDGPFEAIEPLRYGWAERIRQSWLPKTIAG